MLTIFDFYNLKIKRNDFVRKNVGLHARNFKLAISVTACKSL